MFEGGEGARGDELAQSVVAFVVGVFVEPEAVGAHEAVGVGGCAPPGGLSRSIQLLHLGQASAEQLIFNHSFQIHH